MSLKLLSLTLLAKKKKKLEKKSVLSGRLNDQAVKVKKVLWHWLNWCLSCNRQGSFMLLLQDQIHKALKNASTNTLISCLICLLLFCSACLSLRPYIRVLFLTNLHNHHLKTLLHILLHFVFLICLELWATLLNTAAMISSVTFGPYLYSVGIRAEK